MNRTPNCSGFIPRIRWTVHRIRCHFTEFDELYTELFGVYTPNSMNRSPNSVSFHRIRWTVHRIRRIYPEFGVYTPNFSGLAMGEENDLALLIFPRIFQTYFGDHFGPQNLMNGFFGESVHDHWIYGVAACSIIYDAIINTNLWLKCKHYDGITVITSLANIYITSSFIAMRRSKFIL